MGHNHQQSIESKLDLLLNTENDYARYELITNELRALLEQDSALDSGIQLIVQDIGRARKRSSSPYNVSLFIPGSKSNKGRMIMRAHYDTTGAPFRLSLSRRFLRKAPPEPPSADDNLSSVAVLMELAGDYVKEALQGRLPERDTYIEFVTGEEGGQVLNILRFFVPLIFTAPAVELSRWSFSRFSPVVYDPVVIAASYFAVTSALIRLPPTQLGLIGSIARNKELRLTLDDIMLTPDITGAGNEFCVPKSSFGVAPITWGLLPIRYDIRVVDTLRELFLLEDDRATKPKNHIPLSYLTFGASDMAAPDIGLIDTIKRTRNWRYGRRAAGIFSVSPKSILRIHSARDTKQHIKPENLDVVYRVLKRAPQALTQQWKKESDVIHYFNPEKAQIYALNSTNEEIMQLLGKFKGAQISMVYSAEQTKQGYRAKEFLTWGIGRLEEILERQGIKNNVSAIHQKQPFSLEFADTKYDFCPESRFERYLKPLARFNASWTRFASERLALPTALGLIGAEITLIVAGINQLWQSIPSLNTHPLVEAGLYPISGLAGTGVCMAAALATFFGGMAVSPYIGKSLQYLEDLRDRTGMAHLAEQ